MHDLFCNWEEEVFFFFCVEALGVNININVSVNCVTLTGVRLAVASSGNITSDVSISMNSLYVFADDRQAVNGVRVVHWLRGLTLT